ncbi:MAG: hypothetical protein EOP11_19845 [Proteobacteria bacterium]|nr:MAG: hypothetical protein EOP11_19845 [Pseudomonadota bacterium]
MKFSSPAAKCWFESTTQRTPTQSVVNKCGLPSTTVKQFCYWHCSAVRRGSQATCTSLCRLRPAAPLPNPSREREPVRERHNSDANDAAPVVKKRRGSASEAYCETNPYASECQRSEAYCKTNPYSEGCRGSESYCSTNPYSSDCRKSESYCKTNPYSSDCRMSESYCKTNPYSADCRSSEAYCATNPYSSDCRRSEAYCKTNPYSSDCR